MATEQKQNPEEKKTEAKKESFKQVCVRGKDLPISHKHSIAICNMIKNKKIEESIAMLEEVSKLKRAVPMTGEIPHRKGMCSGRYPINASKEFIKLLKHLKANATNLGVDASNFILHGKVDIAARRRSSRRAKFFKRTDVLIELKQNVRT